MTKPISKSERYRVNAFLLKAEQKLKEDLIWNLSVSSERKVKMSLLAIKNIRDRYEYRALPQLQDNATYTESQRKENDKK